MSIYETSNFITAELNKREVKSEYWYAGGGCTLIKVPLPGKGTNGEDAIIVISDCNSSVDLTPEERELFSGWAAVYYATPDNEMYGENPEYVHGEDRIFTAENVVRVGWQENAIEMADAIATFVGNLEYSRV